MFVLRSALIATLLFGSVACSYNDRLAASYALKRAGANLANSRTVYCSTQRWGSGERAKYVTSCY